MRNIILIMFFLAFISCKNDIKVLENNEQHYGVKLVLRGPTECVYQILFNENGDGEMTKGKSKEFYRYPFKSYSEITFKKKFTINSKQKLDSLNAIIDTISKSDLNKGGFYSDTPRKELYLDGKLKIDVYRMTNKEINKIIELIKPSLPTEIQYVCE